jgi:seryl-tRNA synthetase
MLDIKFIRENPKQVRENLKKRGMDEKDVNILLTLDKDWRLLKQENDSLRESRNTISKEINKTKKEGKDARPIIERAKVIPKKIEENEKKLTNLKQKRDSLLANIPNMLDKSVPLGNEDKKKVLRKWGKVKKEQTKNHEEVLENLNLLDTKKASEVAGSRFYYLKNELVKLNQAIINLALDLLTGKGFQLIQPPYMLRKKALEGATTLDAFKDTIYKIQDEDLYLIGTAEHALNALKINEIIPAKNLPIKLAGVSPCFRKEAGSHGKDTKGIFRVHQFEKVEQFVFCKPENAWKEFELILSNTEQIFKALEIPYQIVILSSEDTSKTATKTIDLEGWFPAQQTYRELGSCSNCLDYQARRSNIKVQDKKIGYAYTLNNTAIATERAIVALVENHQQPDGTISIPKALWKYTGFKTIGSKAKKLKPKKIKPKVKKAKSKIKKEKSKVKKKTVKKKPKAKKIKKKPKKKAKVKKIIKKKKSKTKKKRK